MDLTTPLISVLLPFNESSDSENSQVHHIRHRWLRESAESILVQTESDFELLIIGAENVHALKELLPNDSRIRLLSRESDGIVSALNTGFTHARGTFIARMDADDISLPHRFSSQLTLLSQRSEIGITGSKVELIASGRELGEGSRRYQIWLNSMTTPEDIARNIFIESPLAHPAWMLRREVFQQLNGYRDCEWAEDYDFLLRAHLAGVRMAKTETVDLQWREHDNRLTRQSSRYSRSQFIRAKAWALSKSHLNNRQAIIIGTGSNAVKMHDALEEYGVGIESFVDFKSYPPGRTKRSKPVIDYKTLRIHMRRQKPQQKNPPLVVSVVTSFGARKELKNWFSENSFEELIDFVVAG